MKILITGGAGFIGSAVIRLAINRGHTILNIDNLTYASCLDNLNSVVDNPRYTFQKADVQDNKHLEEVFRKFCPDAVMHLAAESHVDRSIKSPGEFINTNILGTFSMLEAARGYWHEKGKPNSFRFHHVSTDEVFGTLQLNSDLKFTEDSHYSPRSPYAASKASSDHLVRAWHSTYALPVVLSNCSNNFGTFQFTEKFIPVSIINALNGKPIPIYGNGQNVRDWLFVEDHAEALLLVLERGRLGYSYNIGAECERTNLEIANKICNILDRIRPRDNFSYSKLIEFVTDRPGHDERYAIDPSLIKCELGWRSKANFEDALEKTVLWYLDNVDWWKPLLKKA